MVKLISGACRIGNALFRPSDGAFSAPQAVEERLVRRGVARYVSADTDVANPPVSPGADSVNPPVSPLERGDLSAATGDEYDAENTETRPPVETAAKNAEDADTVAPELSNAPPVVQDAEEPLRGHFDERFLQSMTNAKLKELAEDLGLDTSSMHKKADYVAAILQVEVEVGDEQIPGLEDGKYTPDSELPDLDLGAEDPVT